MSSPIQGRRRFLVVACSTMAVASLGLACSSAPSGPVSAGNVSAVPVGHLAFVPGSALVLGRDAGGLYAMTTICTHQQCDMSQSGSVSASGVRCGCHGASFSANGAVLGGPARTALEHYRVDLAADGSITIQEGTVVDAAARTAVA